MDHVYDLGPTSDPGEPRPQRRVVTVVVPHFNDPRLPACLAALAELEEPAGWRIERVVVDNGSDVPPRELVETTSDATFVLEPSGGSYAARLAGLAVSTGEVIAFTDSDCRPDKDWLSVAIGRLEADPGIAAVAGRVRTVFDGERPDSAVGWWERIEAFPQHEYVRDGYGVTANLVVRREAGESVGWFDAGAMSGGDRDFGRRLTASGRVLVYEDDAVVSHPARTSWRELLTKGGRTAKGEARLETLRHAGPRDFAVSSFWWAFTVVRVLKRALTHPGLPDRSARAQYLTVGVVFRVFWFAEKCRWRVRYARHGLDDA